MTIPNRPETASRKRPQLSALTGARFLAALHVVFFHFMGPQVLHGPAWARSVIDNGARAVEFFFMLSGFVLAYNYLDGRKLEARKFWTARFARIYPAFFLGFLWMAPFFVPYLFAVSPPRTAALKAVLSSVLSVTMTQAWIPKASMTWNAVAWSLSVEALLYAVFPLAALGLVRSGRSRLAAFGGFAALLCLVRPLIHALSPHSATMDALTAHFPLLWVPAFLVGVVLGKLYLGVGRVRFSGWLADLGFVAALLAMAFPPASEVLMEGIVVLAFSAMIYGLAGGTGMLAALCKLPPMVLAGDASYSVYILQLPAAFTLHGILFGFDSWKLGDGPLTMLFTTPAMLALYIAVLVTVSIVCLKVIEAPARRAIRRSLQRPAAAIPPSATAPGAEPSPVG